jgi:exopolyphosphatase/guanosine-5'-triphosphate,3'-diphosphate pyrophosphatase
MKFAAIDIGSNAMRLLFVNVVRESDRARFHKLSLIRVPVRLGMDAFTEGVISPERREDFIKTMVAFRHLIDVYKVDDYLAYATSAMREARNGHEVAQAAELASGIPIHIISGEEEAQTFYKTHIAEDIDPTRSFLYVDVGGGSTELTVFHSGRYAYSESFRLGTLRLLNDIAPEEEWHRLADWIRTHVNPLPNLEVIGTGGNINKVFKLTQIAEGKPMSLEKLSETRDFLARHSYEERVSVLGLRPDRADVIIPATDIYLFILKEASVNRIYVPKVGLADGMVHMMHEQRMRRAEVAVY